MDDGEHIHLVGLDVVDDAAGAFQDFSNLLKFELWHNTAGQREFGDLLGSPRQTVNDAQTVLR